MSETQRKPDYRLKAMNKVTGEKATIGAAWDNLNGSSISIVLNPFTTLTASKDLVLTLFPIDGKETT